jgi:hypothetical protein
MRLAAYIMLSDPEWMAASIASYYHAVETILATYDQDGLGWTGRPLDVRAARDLLPSLDPVGKCRLLPGRFARPGFTPIENDTYQRQCALDALSSNGCDWVLQADTDEVFPTLAPLERLIAEAERMGATAVEWPMRTFFQRLPDGRFLEIRGAKGQADYGYPGPVLVRPNERLTEARRTTGLTLRPVVEGDVSSPSLQPGAVGENVRLKSLLRPEEAIWHFSWVRSEEAMRAKLATWGHARDFDVERFYRRVWLAAPRRWRHLRNFHPLRGPWWPRLEPVSLPIQRLMVGDAGEMI